MDDRNIWGVIGDIASNTGNTLQHYQQSKLDARHKAHLDALAQRHAQEQYDAQMRGLDIREQQALTQQHAAEVRDSYNQSRLDQIGAGLEETGRHNRVMEENAGIRESRIAANNLKTIPDYRDFVENEALPEARKNWGSQKTAFDNNSDVPTPGPYPTGLTVAKNRAGGFARKYGLNSPNAVDSLSAVGAGQVWPQPPQTGQDVWGRPIRGIGLGWDNLTPPQQPEPTLEEIEAELARRQGR